MRDIQRVLAALVTLGGDLPHGVAEVRIPGTTLVVPAVADPQVARSRWRLGLPGVDTGLTVGDLDGDDLAALIAHEGLGVMAGLLWRSPHRHNGELRAHAPTVAEALEALAAMVSNDLASPSLVDRRDSTVTPASGSAMLLWANEDGDRAGRLVVVGIASDDADGAIGRTLEGLGPAIPALVDLVVTAPTAAPDGETTVAAAVIDGATYLVRLADLTAPRITDRG